ncbi:phosphatidylinositol glycan anchor biosynthesis class G isoform X2 [Arctopsyche grandis]|uniref:phosphatidylinositol glycan anchor biosynthesis class G isoform X2 n=1 Tax=Arctopsyche grandis TaxID=121162 RepID=UPI00406D7D8E
MLVEMLLPVVRLQWVSLLTLYFAFGGFIIFLYGFFPLKYHGGSDSAWEDLPTKIGDIGVDAKKLYVRNHTRTVLMVIDALRYDFMSEKYMPYTAGLIKDGKACLYKAQAEPPTVTMPRIKAMTTGSISNFIDVALNFGSSAVTEDSFINQAKYNKRTLVFYGDDTWLRLFPNSFMRSDGTTSFYVSDFTEVDLNVTRHLPKELSPAKPDWDLMILHYLGLDHIGHLEGPSSPKVFPKMLEMDNVVEMIMNASRKWDEETILIICGDHGMKDSGSHGGASHSEIIVPLVLTQNKGCSPTHPSEVDQIDLAPTLSYLLSVPFPGGSTGQILPQILTKNGDLLSKESLYTLHYNAKMNVDALIKILGEEEAYKKECYKQYLSAVKHHADWLDPTKTGSSKMAAGLYRSSLNNMSHYLTKSIVEFDMFAIVLGIFTIFATFLCQILITIVTYKSEDDTNSNKMYHFNRSNLQTRLIMMCVAVCISCSLFTVVCGVSQTESSLCKVNIVSLSGAGMIIAILATNFVIIRNIRNNIKNIGEMWILNAIEVFLIVGTIVQPVTYGGTSFIEEEHQIWYFFWTTVTFLTLAYTAKVLLDYYRKKSENATEVQDKESLSAKMDKTAKTLWPQWMLLMMLHRFLRTLNQTGDKWAFLPDAGDWLTKDENIEILSLFSIAALFSTIAICQNNLQTTLIPYKTNCVLIIAATLCIFLYRVTIQSIHIPFYGYLDFNENYIVRVFWVVILIIILIEIWSSKQYIEKEIKSVVSVESRSSNPTKVTYVGENYAFGAKNHQKYNVPGQVDSSSSFLLSSIHTEVSFRMKLMKSRTNVFINVMMLVCSLYLRPHNLILVPSICITSKIVNRILDHKFDSILPTYKEKSSRKNVFCKTLFHIWMGSLFYFYQGNSNSLASVDIGSGYIGLDSYIPPVIALQMGIHTYTGPILSSFLLFGNLVQENNQWDKFLVRIKENLAIVSTHRMFVLLVYTIVSSILRYHLFVWTVISPKLLFEFTSTFFTMATMLIMMVFCCTVLWQERLASSSKTKNVKTKSDTRNFED